VLARAIDLIQLRRRQEPAGLEALIANETLPTDLRVSALAALAGTRPRLSQAHFSFLYDQLRSGNQARVRQQAAGVLGSVELSDAQLQRLATEYLPTADAFILPRLVPVFERGARSPQVGSALIAALKKSASLDSFSEEALQDVFKQYPASVQTEARPLMTRLSGLLAQRRQRLDAMEATVQKGDIDRGRAVFFGKAACSSCHTVGREGGTFGPDLTSLGRDRSRHDVLESIVFPSASFVREYETYKIATRTAEYMGMVKQQTPQAIVVATGPGTTVRIPREEVARMEGVPVSMMPPGLDQLLSRRELADLLAFFIGQDQDPSRAADRDLLR
jgi:putative heme-binding domain-containing protein